MTSFGVNLSFAVKRWPEPERWAAFVREELDVELVQFTFDLLDPWWPEALRKDLVARISAAVEDNGLVLHSAFVGLSAYTYNALLHPDEDARRAAKVWFTRAIDAASEMGARAVGGPIGGLSLADVDRPGERERRYEQLCDTLVELSEHARAQGLESLLVEPTPLLREIPCTVDESKRLLDDVGPRAAVPVRYCIDVGHALYEPMYGENARLEAWLAPLGEAIGMVHLQQTDGQSDSHWGFTRNGIVTPDGTARAMRDAGLDDVPLLLEVFYPFEESDEAVARDVKESVRLCKDALASSTQDSVSKSN